MFGRKFVAAATTVMLLLMATAAQAAPPSTATLIAGWSVGSGRLVVETVSNDYHRGTTER